MSDNLHHTSPVMYPNSPSLGRWTLGGRPRGASASEGSLASQTAPLRRTSTDGERASLPTVHSLRQGTWGAASGKIGTLVYGLLDLRGAIPGYIGRVDRIDRVPKSLYWGYALLYSSRSKFVFSDDASLRNSPEWRQSSRVTWPENCIWLQWRRGQLRAALFGKIAEAGVGCGRKDPAPSQNGRSR